jgi:C4-dicarboxylate-specific signal transduction histidine kinase
MKQRRFGSSLALRIVLPLAAALVAVFGFAAVILGTSVRDEALRELTDRARLLASTLAYNAELPMLARDSVALEALLAGAGRAPDIFGIGPRQADRKLASFSAATLQAAPGATGSRSWSSGGR